MLPVPFGVCARTGAEQGYFFHRLVIYPCGLGLLRLIAHDFGPHPETVGVSDGPRQLVKAALLLVLNRAEVRARHPMGGDSRNFGAGYFLIVRCVVEIQHGDVEELFATEIVSFRVNQHPSVFIVVGQTLAHGHPRRSR